MSSLKVMAALLVTTRWHCVAYPVCERTMSYAFCHISHMVTVEGFMVWSPKILLYYISIVYYEHGAHHVSWKIINLKGKYLLSILDRHDQICSHLQAITVTSGYQILNLTAMLPD